MRCATWRVARRAVLVTLACGLGLQFAELLSWALKSSPESPLSFLHGVFISGIAACGIVVLLPLIGWARPGNAWFVAVIAMFFLVGVAYLHSSAPPHIDVYEFQQRGSAALLSGRNPFTASYPNIYGDETPLYSESLYENDRLLFGFPYPPFSLFLCLPGYLLTGDVRYSHLAAIVFSALLMGLARDGLVSKLAALLFLFSPAVFWIVHESWTEPFAILLTSVLVFRSLQGRCRPWLLGLLMSSKQYTLLAAPAAWFLVPDRSWAGYGKLMLRSNLKTKSRKSAGRIPVYPPN